MGSPCTLRSRYSRFGKSSEVFQTRVGDAGFAQIQPAEVCQRPEVLQASSVMQFDPGSASGESVRPLRFSKPRSVIFVPPENAVPEPSVSPVRCSRSASLMALPSRGYLQERHAEAIFANSTLPPNFLILANGLFLLGVAVSEHKLSVRNSATRRPSEWSSWQSALGSPW